MKIALVLSMALFATAVLVPIHDRTSAAEAASPAPDGLAILNRSCTSCHDKSQATQVRPAAEWQPVLERMRDNGANISDADAKILLAYLTSNYSRK